MNMKYLLHESKNDRNNIVYMKLDNLKFVFAAKMIDVLRVALSQPILSFHMNQTGNEHTKSLT